MITEIARKHPKESYAAVNRSIQTEWIFLQCMTKYTGKVFKISEKFLREMFLHYIFFGRLKTLPPVVGYLGKFPVNKNELGLHNNIE